MSSLENKLKKLEKTLLAGPREISVYDDMPYAIYLYLPEEEWTLRNEIEGLIIRLSHNGKQVSVISFEKVLWELIRNVESIDSGEGLNALIEQETSMGFSEAQKTIQKYLSGELYGNSEISIIDAIEKHAKTLDPQKDVIFLMHAGALSPHMYHISSMAERMQDRKIAIPVIIFYPGTKEGTISLRFMDLRDKEPTGNYRIKIFGDEA